MSRPLKQALAASPTRFSVKEAVKKAKRKTAPLGFYN
jgi:hypothetical protein